jgi:ribokinase
MVDAASEPIAAAAVVCAQLEVPVPSVRRALEIARAGGALTVLTPAPASAEAADLLALADVVVPNLGEARALAGEPAASAEMAADRLRGLGAGAVAVTLGAAGALVAGPQGLTRIPALRVAAVVDTTGAGDTLAGVLAAGLAGRMPLVDAARLAVAAAGIGVSRRGAQPSMPTMAEIRAAAAGAPRMG